MSTWIKEKPAKSWGQSFCENVLKCGNIPRHIAIIMDGNRRFAVKKKYERCVGHLLGFNKVSETLEWCSGLGVREVTLYAFSLENFKRSQEEVDCLMELAKKKFSALLAEKDMVMKHSLCVRIIGNLTYLPRDLQVILAQVIDFTKHNNKVFLNVCCAYTSQEEMWQSMKKMQRGVEAGFIVPSDIDETLFEKSLYTRHCTEPDILIRTSGELRLSDFLLWQTSFSMLSFTAVLWPEFSRWHLYSFILLYQLNHHHFMKVREERSRRRRRQRLEDDCRVTRQLMKQFNPSLTLKDHLDLSHLDALIRKLKINEDDDDEVFSGINTQIKYATAAITSTVVAITNKTEATTTPATNDDEAFGRLLEAVVACREDRCSRFLKKLNEDYHRYISCILNIGACVKENGRGIKNGYRRNEKHFSGGDKDYNHDKTYSDDNPDSNDADENDDNGGGDNILDDKIV